VFLLSLELLSYSNKAFLEYKVSDTFAMFMNKQLCFLNGGRFLAERGKNEFVQELFPYLWLDLKKFEIAGMVL
jgi:hypothetical protein